MPRSFLVKRFSLNSPVSPSSLHSESEELQSVHMSHPTHHHHNLISRKQQHHHDHRYPHNKINQTSIIASSADASPVSESNPDSPVLMPEDLTIQTSSSHLESLAPIVTMNGIAPCTPPPSESSPSGLSSSCGGTSSSEAAVSGSSLMMSSLMMMSSPLPTPTLTSALSSSCSSSESSSPSDSHICPDCGKRYSTSSNLARHRQTHRSVTDKKARKCPHCEKVYVSMPAFSMHVRTHSQGCECPYCGKRFSRPWLLQGHIRTHTGEKPFKCPICSKAFADKSNLRAHIQTHSTSKPYVCERCGKAFALKSYLYKHEESSCMRIHRTNSSASVSSHLSLMQRSNNAGTQSISAASADMEDMEDDDEDVMDGDLDEDDIDPDEELTSCQSPPPLNLTMKGNRNSDDDDALASPAGEVHFRTSVASSPSCLPPKISSEYCPGSSSSLGNKRQQNGTISGPFIHKKVHHRRVERSQNHTVGSASGAAIMSMNTGNKNNNSDDDDVHTHHQMHKQQHHHNTLHHANHNHHPHHHHQQQQKTKGLYHTPTSAQNELNGNSSLLHPKKSYLLQHYALLLSQLHQTLQK